MLLIVDLEVLHGIILSGSRSHLWLLCQLLLLLFPRRFAQHEVLKGHWSVCTLIVSFEVLEQQLEHPNYFRPFLGLPAARLVNLRDQTTPVVVNLPQTLLSQRQPCLIGQALQLSLVCDLLQVLALEVFLDLALAFGHALISDRVHRCLPLGPC